MQSGKWRLSPAPTSRFPDDMIEYGEIYVAGSAGCVEAWTPEGYSRYHGAVGGELGMAEETGEDLETQLALLKARLAERSASIPAHSIRPHQLIEIEELEDEIAILETRLTSAQQRDADADIKRPI